MFCLDLGLSFVSKSADKVPKKYFEIWNISNISTNWAYFRKIWPLLVLNNAQVTGTNGFGFGKVVIQALLFSSAALFSSLSADCNSKSKPGLTLLRNAYVDKIFKNVRLWAVVI